MPGVKDWIKKSSSDLKASQKLLDDEETLDCAVFHAHQCAEKIFKAFSWTRTGSTFILACTTFG